MSESHGDEIIQRDLLGNPIERKIPRAVDTVAAEQITLDSWMDKINNPGIKVEIKQESSTDKPSRKKPWQKLIINKGTRDEFTLLGRYYTPSPGREIWSVPAERRDAFPKLRIEENDIIFQVKGSDIRENGIRWVSVIDLARTLPGEDPIIRGHGYMRWSEINKK